MRDVFAGQWPVGDRWNVAMHVFVRVYLVAGAHGVAINSRTSNGSSIVFPYSQVGGSAKEAWREAMDVRSDDAQGSNQDPDSIAEDVLDEALRRLVERGEIKLTRCPTCGNTKIEPLDVN